MSPSHDPRLGHFAIEPLARAAAPARPTRRRRSVARSLVKVLGVLVAMAAVIGAVIAVGSAVPQPGSAAPITERQWLMIAKDPDAHSGERVVVYGEVTQFDAATGRTVMRAEVTGEPNPTGAGTNTVVTGGDQQLRNFVEGDLFRAEVTVVGSRSYETQIGGNTITPELDITKIVPQPAR